MKRINKSGTATSQVETKYSPPRVEAAGLRGRGGAGERAPPDGHGGRRGEGAGISSVEPGSPFRSRDLLCGSAISPQEPGSPLWNRGLPSGTGISPQELRSPLRRRDLSGTGVSPQELGSLLRTWDLLCGTGISHVEPGSACGTGLSLKSRAILCVAGISLRSWDPS